MKTHTKKKRFQAHCREQVKKGLINNERGDWVKYSDSGPNGRMHIMMRDGYKVK